MRGYSHRTGREIQVSETPFSGEGAPGLRFDARAANAVDVYVKPAQALLPRSTLSRPRCGSTGRSDGYQVLKKWLSYRERSVLGRALHPEEVQHFTDTARRIAAIVLEVSANDSGVIRSG